MIGAIVFRMAAPAASGPVVVNDENSGARRLHGSDAGIDCVLAVPGRGVFEPADRRLIARDRLLYGDLDGKPRRHR